MSDIEARIRRLEDIESIRQLKARYLYCCDHKDPAGVRACFVDGPLTIDYGPVGQFDNADALVSIYTQIACHDHMVEMHHGSNPQIHIVDDKNARGSWSLRYVLIDTRNEMVNQLAGYYDDEYRKEGGEWKISATRFVASSTLLMNLTEDGLMPAFAGSSPPAP